MLLEYSSLVESILGRRARYYLGRWSSCCWRTSSWWRGTFATIPGREDHHYCHQVVATHVVSMHLEDSSPVERTISNMASWFPAGWIPSCSCGSPVCWRGSSATPPGGYQPGGLWQKQGVIIKPIWSCFMKKTWCFSVKDFLTIFLISFKKGYKWFSMEDQNCGILLSERCSDCGHLTESLPWSMYIVC